MDAGSATESRRARGGARWTFPLAAAAFAVLFVHVALAFHFVPPGLAFGGEPFAGRDFNTHVEQTLRVTDALDGWGRTWAYDVQLLAGYPNGTIFDADNKGWELWTFALWKLGLSRATAFNLFVVAAHLLVPFVVFLAARLFGLDRATALVAAGLASGMWFFDGFAHWTWWVGMVSYAFAAYLFLLPLALFHRHLESGRVALLVPLALLLAAGHLVHPYIFFSLVFVMLALLVRARSRLSPRGIAAIALVAVFTVAVNAYWLVVALRFWRYVVDVKAYGLASPLYVLTDYFGLLNEPEVTGLVGNRTGLRFFAIAAAAVALVRWRRSGDRLFVPFAVGLGALVGAAYLGSVVGILDRLQPYRFVLPGMFLATIPAGALAVDLWRSRDLRGLAASLRAGLAVALVAASIHLVRDVLYFFPAALPDPARASRCPSRFSRIARDLGIPLVRTVSFRIEPPFGDFMEVARWVADHDDGQGRVLVESWGLGEFLASRTRAQILGGFRMRNLEHAAANLFRRHLEGDLEAADLRRYLEDYAVRWVVITHPRPALERRFELLAPEPVAPRYRIAPERIYRTRTKVSFFAENDGRIEASLNRIAVAGTRPREDVVLRFHFLETLVCRPGCRLEREPLEGDAVGFIRVRAPHPADFVIENGY